MSKINSYRDLEVWQLAMTFAEAVYGVLKAFPAEERFALSNQIRRAVVSIPSNIAEGFGRDSTKDLLHFLAIAKGSLFEVATQLELAIRLGYMTQNPELDRQSTSIGMMLNALSSKLRAHAGL